MELRPRPPAREKDGAICYAAMQVLQNLQRLPEPASRAAKDRPDFKGVQATIKPTK
jgi:hypothetical protein